MKKSIYFIFFLFMAVLLPANQILGAEKAKQHERFMLFNAEYNSAAIQQSKTTIFLEKRLFKIDTQTGQTWMLIDVIKEQQDLKYWKKITEKRD